MIIGGTNVIDWGVVVGDRSPSRSAAATQQIIEGAPGAWRRVRMGRGAPDAAQINVTGYIVGISLADLRSNIDRFKYELRPDAELTIGFSDYSDREWLGYRQNLVINDITPGWVTEGVSFSLVILCPDPFARDPSLQDGTDSGTGEMIITPTLGTAPMPVIITLTGNNGSPITNPVFQYRDGSDTVITSISLTDVLDGTETVVIDTEFMTAIKNGSTNVAGLISGTYFDVNPDDAASYPTGLPDIRFNTSGVADLFKVEWRRRYW